MSLFNAGLINHPIDDPGVYLEFKHRRQAILFDLGDLHALPPRKILKIDHIFVSHTHMDHFIGFDHLVRICLGRNRRIALFGPTGFIQNIEDRQRAAKTYHLTARQAGMIAREAGVKRLVLFHMSPKYKGCEEALVREATEAFGA